MNKIYLHSLVLLAGTLGCAAYADDTNDLPSRELLKSYTYQSEALAFPPATLPAANPAVFEPTVAPDFATTKPTDYNWRDLEEAMAQNKEKTHVLFTWDWREDSQWEMLGRPGLESLDIPWSPMTTPNNSTLPSASNNNATAKLQARFPLVSLVW
jgi:hypothetical protein